MAEVLYVPLCDEPPAHSQRIESDVLWLACADDPRGFVEYLHPDFGPGYVYPVM